MTPANGGIVLQGAPVVMLAIAQCESGQRQFYADGSLVIGPTKDIGYFQISPLWKSVALKHGWNINTETGNIEMALWLYHQYGTEPWDSSFGCWGNNLV